MGLRMLEGKQVSILTEEDFEDIELMETLRAMRGAGAKVLIVGSGSKCIYRGKKGNITVIPDTTADKVKPEDIDAIIVPGGYAPDKMRLCQAMLDLIRTVYAEGKIIAAVCHGPQLLISASIVRGRRLTSWPSIAVDLRNAGAIWVDEPVVRDGNLITSRKPADLPKLNKAIIESLIGAGGVR